METASQFKSLASNSFFAAISEASTVFLFVLFIFAARYLGDADFGIFSFAMAFASIFGIFYDLGLRYVYVREVARERKRAEDYLGNILLIQLGLSLLTLGAVVAAAHLLHQPPLTRQVVYLMAGAESLRAAKYLYRFVFRALDQFRYESLTVLLERSLLLGVGLAVLVLGGSVVVFAAAFLLVRLADVIVTVSVASWKAFPPRLKANTDLWPFLFRQTLPFALSGVVLLLFGQISTVLLSLFRTDAEVGWYSAAYKLIEGLALVPAILSSSLYPSISRLHKDAQAVTNLFQRGVKYVLLAAIPMTIIGLVLSGDIIHLVYGPEYVQSIPVLQIALIGIAFIFLHDVGGTVLAAVDRQKQAFYIACGILGLNVSLNLILVPRFGHLGAAASMMASETIYGLIVMSYLAVLGYRIPYFRLAFPPLVSAGAAATALYLLHLPVLLALPLAVVIYLGLLTLFSYWDPEEIALAKTGGLTVGRLIHGFSKNLSD